MRGGAGEEVEGGVEVGKWVGVRGGVRGRMGDGDG